MNSFSVWAVFFRILQITPLDRFRFAGSNDKKITKYRFWQEGNHAELIYLYDFYMQKLNYIHLNPVRQEIVSRPEDYLYSSVVNYSGGEGLLKIMFLDV